MSIHQRIKQRRLAVGLTSHQALADIIGVSWQTVQLWEKEGGTAPNRNRIDAVAKALETSPGWLLHGTQDQADPGDNLPLTVHVAHRMDWMSDAESELLSLFRTTDENGRWQIMNAAKTVKKVLFFKTDSNQL